MTPLRGLAVLMALALSREVRAVDVDGVSVGDACARIETTGTIRRASEPLGDLASMRASGTYVFDGTWAGGVDAAVDYNCDTPGGRIVSATLLAHSEDRAEVDALYRQMRDRVVEEAGLPDSELGAEGEGQSPPGKVGGPPIWTIRKATWGKLAHERVEIELRRDNALGFWSVVIRSAAK